MGEILQSIYLRLSDGRLLHYTGRKQIEENKKVYVVDVVAFNHDNPDTELIELLENKEKENE